VNRLQVSRPEAEKKRMATSPWHYCVVATCQWQAVWATCWAGLGWPDLSYLNLPPPLSHHRVGYISTVPGSKITFAVSSVRQGGDASGKMSVVLSYLKSYAHMGQASAECVEGCQCDPLHLDGYHTSKTSTLYLALLVVSQHANCVIGAAWYGDQG